MDENDGEEKDDVKRKSRNLSEKKRRDQFNLLINELAGMVAAGNRKMDKSTVLKATIASLKNQKGMKSQSLEIRDDFDLSFISNEEFTHLMLEAMDAFIMTLSCSGQILYTSDSIAPLLGYSPNDLNGMSLCNFVPVEEQEEILRFLGSQMDFSELEASYDNKDIGGESQSLSIDVLRKSVPVSTSSSAYERINMVGYFQSYKCPSEDGVPDVSCSETEEPVSVEDSNDINSSFQHSEMQVAKPVFIAVCRLENPQLLREMVIFEPTKSEFVSRHSLEWKFIFLDHRASTIIGYLPFEVLGTSGYDYCHADDLEKVSECHEILMKKGKGTSCYYRFLTKGQQWIWLQSHYYITYHQWNSKPEFIVCNNTVVSYGRVSGFSEITEKDSLDNEMNAPIISGNEAGCSKSSSSSLLPESITVLKGKAEDIKMEDSSLDLSDMQLQCDVPSGSFCDKKVEARKQHYLIRNPKNVSQFKSREDVPSQPQKDQFHLRRLKSADQESVHSTLDSCSSSASSQYSLQTSYSMPHYLHLGSCGEPPPWSKRTKSTCHYSSVGFSGESSSHEGTSRKKRLQSYQRRQLSRTHHFSHSQIQQQTQKPPVIIADDLDSLHSSETSEMSVNSRTSRSPLVKKILQNQYGTNKWKTSGLTFDSEMTYDSHRTLPESKDNKKSEPILQFMVQTTRPSFSTNIDMRSVSTDSSGLLSPSSGSSLRHQSHLQRQQQFLEQQQFASSSHQTTYSGADPNFSGESTSGQMAQVTTVPFTPVIPIQPVVTNHIVQIANTTSTGFRQTFMLTPEQQHLQEQLRRKHSELQQLILKQQEELRQVNKQLDMAQYAIDIHMNKNTLQFNTPTSMALSTSLTYQPSLGNASTVTTSIGRNSFQNFSSIPIQAGVPLDSSSLSYLQNPNITPEASTLEGHCYVPISSNFVGSPTHAFGVHGVSVPYQLPQHQFQMLFAQPNHSINSSFILQSEQLLPSADAHQNE